MGIGAIAADINQHIDAVRAHTSMPMIGSAVFSIGGIFSLRRAKRQGGLTLIAAGVIIGVIGSGQ